MAAAGSRPSASSAIAVSPSAEQSSAARLDEAPDERPVLVERRPVPRAVLLEHELDVGSLLDLATEEREGAEAEAAQS